MKEQEQQKEWETCLKDNHNEEEKRKGSWGNINTKKKMKKKEVMKQGNMEDEAVGGLVTCDEAACFRDVIQSTEYFFVTC